jgi:hypothetical protein
LDWALDRGQWLASDPGFSSRNRTPDDQGIGACVLHRAGLELVALNKLIALCGNPTPVFQAAVNHVTELFSSSHFCYKYLGTNSAWTLRCLFPSEARIYKAVFLAYVKVRTEFLQNMIDWYCDSIMRMLPQDRQSATPVFTFSIWESRSFMTIGHKDYLQPETASAFKTVSYFYFDLHFICPHL